MFDRPSYMDQFYAARTSARSADCRSIPPKAAVWPGERDGDMEMDNRALTYPLPVVQKLPPVER